MRRTCLLTAMAVALALLAQCDKKKTDGDDNETPPDLTNWNAHCALMSQAGAYYDTLAALGDTSAAVDSAIAFFTRSSSVAWAVFNGRNGVSVRFTDSTPGVLVTGTLDYASGTYSASGLLTESPPDLLTGGTVPSKNGSAYYSPIYTEHEPAREVYCTMSEDLPKVGYPTSVDLWKDCDVTLNRLASAPGRGVIQLFGHGMPYPDKNNICESYFVTGECVNPCSDSIYHEELTGAIPLIRETGSLKYAVSPTFLKNHIGGNWQTYKPLVYGSFCYSSRGTWATTMTSMGASAYLGWDGEVCYPENHAWACSLYTFMCDTPTTDPYTCTISAFAWKYLYYYWYTGQTGARLCFSGDPSVTFQQPVPDGWYVGGYCPVFGFAGANLYGSNGELDIVFAADSSIPPSYPMACITILNGAALTPGSTVRPDDFTLLYSPDSGYINWPEWSRAPLYVSFTEAKFTSPLGKVSGVIGGYVYACPERYPGDTFPLPIHGTFTNLTVNVLPTPNAADASRPLRVAGIRARAGVGRRTIMAR